MKALLFIFLSVQWILGDASVLIYESDTEIRCYEGEEVHNRQKRFAPSNNRWDRLELTWDYVGNYSKLDYDDIISDISKALLVWQSVSPIQFFRAGPYEEPDLKFSFEQLDHGDFFHFDGRGGTLAHAFYPSDGIGGDIHLDADENWVIGDHPYSISLFSALVHELGHAIGLHHSDVRSSIMYPSYKFHSYALNASDDDRLAISWLYEGKHSPSKKFKNKRIQQINKEKVIDTFCNQNFNFLANINEEYYLFENYSHIRVSNGKFFRSFSIPNNEYFQDFPENETVVHAGMHDRTIFLFTESRYFRYLGGVILAPGYPRPISDLNLEFPELGITGFLSKDRILYLQNADFWLPYQVTGGILKQRTGDPTFLRKLGWVHRPSSFIGQYNDTMKFFIDRRVVTYNQFMRIKSTTTLSEFLGIPCGGEANALSGTNSRLSLSLMENVITFLMAIASYRFYF